MVPVDDAWEPNQEELPDGPLKDASELLLLVQKLKRTAKVAGSYLGFLSEDGV